MRITESATVAGDSSAIFALATDLDRLLALSGLPAGAYEPARRDGRMVRIAKASMMGMALVWYEDDVEWAAPERLTLTRVFERGPVTTVKLDIRVRDSANGRSDVTWTADIDARGAMGALASRMVLARRMRAGFRALAAALSTQAADKASVRSGARIAVDEAALAERYKACLEYPRLQITALDALVDIARRGSDAEARRLNLLSLADARRLPVRELIRAACIATRTGILVLRWKIRCPNCRQVAASHDSLGTLTETSHCDMCNIDFATRFDESVEAVFGVHDAIRRVDEREFCAVGPAYQPTRLLQIQVAPTSSRTVPLQLRGGQHTVRALEPSSSRRQVVVSRAESAAPTPCTYDPDLPSQEPVAATPGWRDFVLTNGRSTPLTVVVERSDVHESWVSASLVITLPDFRDLFAREALAPGVGLSVEHAAFLFSDLKGSTAMYEELGDAEAFALVRQHFDVLTQAVLAHEGAVVKTIGDAVMAVFAAPHQALEAALDSMAKLATFNAKSGKPWLVLKIGVHAGPCLVVSQNQRLDYFGTTVNAAARAQGESSGGDIVATARLLEYPEVAALVRERALAAEPFRRELKGLREVFDLVRLRESVAPLRASGVSANPTP